MMEVNFCDTNILLGISHPDEKFHKKCKILMEDSRYNFTYSYRSFDEINDKMKNVRKLLPQIKNYLREPKLMKSQLNEEEIRLIKSFLKNRQIYQSFRDTKYTDREIFQLVRDYEYEIILGKKEILSKYDIEPFCHYETRGTIPNINSTTLLNIAQNWIQKNNVPQNFDCKLILDGIIGFKCGCLINNWKKISIISNDGDILNQKTNLIRDIVNYFKSINDTITIDFLHIKDLIKD